MSPEQLDACVSRLRDSLSGEALEDLHLLAAYAREVRTALGRMLEVGEHLSAFVDAKAGGTERYPCSPTCTHDAAISGYSGRVKDASRAAKGALDPLPKLGIYGPAEVAAWEAGTEAMRAACWEALQPFMDKHGFSPSEREEAKAAIEGAAP